MLLSGITLLRALSVPLQALYSSLPACCSASFPASLTVPYSFLKKPSPPQSYHSPQGAYHSSVRESYHSSGQFSSHSVGSPHDLVSSHSQIHWQHHPDAPGTALPSAP